MFRLHQTPINCSECGDYVWDVYKIILGEKGEERQDPICATCRPSLWVELIKHVVKFESLDITNKSIVKEKPSM